MIKAVKILKDNRGFTLIEVLISIAILVFISLFLYQVTTSTFNLRESLIEEGDFFSGIRLAMNVVDRDVSQIYTPILMIPNDPAASGLLSGAVLTQNQMAAIQGSGKGTTATKFYLEVVNSVGIRPTRFQGNDKSMSFVSLSNVRIYKESKESEFARISYDIIDDKSPDAIPGTRILRKSVNVSAFDDEEGSLNAKDKLWKFYSLLPGIKEINFKYYRHDKKQWFSTWDSDSQETKYLLPDMIEMKIKATAGDRLNFDGAFYFKTEIPHHGLSPTS
ncbi:MAG: prepilin-type N-terminal cleavage/methylation domain-containing protein [Bdellovibrionales bacterium]|nr:prepilin-type N-terminal cleavage/methylation domain-containing protein [Bdellovibrionales bacterium]